MKKLFFTLIGFLFVICITKGKTQNDDLRKYGAKPVELINSISEKYPSRPRTVNDILRKYGAKPVELINSIPEEYPSRPRTVNDILRKYGAKPFELNSGNPNVNASGLTYNEVLRKYDAKPVEFNGGNPNLDARGITYNEVLSKYGAKPVALINSITEEYSSRPVSDGNFYNAGRSSDFESGYQDYLMKERLNFFFTLFLLLVLVAVLWYVIRTYLNLGFNKEKLN
jgi:hypothetical protein